MSRAERRARAEARRLRYAKVISEAMGRAVESTPRTDKGMVPMGPVADAAAHETMRLIVQSPQDKTCILQAAIMVRDWWKATVEKMKTGELEPKT